MSDVEFVRMSTLRSISRKASLRSDRNPFHLYIMLSARWPRQFEILPTQFRDVMFQQQNKRLSDVLVQLSGTFRKTNFRLAPFGQASKAMKFFGAHLDGSRPCISSAVSAKPMIHFHLNLNLRDRTNPHLRHLRNTSIFSPHGFCRSLRPLEPLESFNWYPQSHPQHFYFGPLPAIRHGAKRGLHAAVGHHGWAEAAYTTGTETDTAIATKGGAGRQGDD
jgi:hypothetical protein